MDRYPYFKYTILLGATRALAHLGTYFTHRVFGLSTPIDLFPLPSVFEPAENFAKHIHDLHAEIRRKISLSKEEYKLVAAVYRRSKEFNVGEYVMVHIRPERIPKTFSKKLYARSMGPYSVIRKMGFNAYLLDLPNDMDISSVFNVGDLLPY